MIRNAIAIASVVLVLQLPYLVHRLSHPDEPAMAAVTGSVADVLSGRASIRLRESIAGYLNAVNGIEIEPWHIAFTGWLLVASGIVVAIQYRRDVPLLMVTLVRRRWRSPGMRFFSAGWITITTCHSCRPLC